jgi:Flp pilus assembly protein TadD
MEAEAALELADIYRQTGQAAKLDHITAAIMGHPEVTPDLRLRLARILHQADRFAPMIRVLDAWVDTAGRGARPDALLDVARMYVDAEESSKAGNVLEEYLRGEPDDWRAWLDLAALKKQVHDVEGAASALQRAVEHGGDTARRVIAGDRRFDALR